MSKLLLLREVCARVRLGKSAIWARVRDGTFPAPIKIGDRARAWLADEVDAWIDRRVEMSRERPEMPQQPANRSGAPGAIDVMQASRGLAQRFPYAIRKRHRVPLSRGVTDGPGNLTFAVRKAGEEP